MLSAEARGRLVVVLVGARNPQNIGAAARAMQDFGFHKLRVVNAFAPPFEAARLEAKSAVGASDVMASAELFSDLPKAIRDCTLVAGTTAIGGRHLDAPILPLHQAAEDIRSAVAELTATADLATAGRVALLFGSEKTGLTRDELSHCTRLLTIPMFAPEGRHLSMNLGQAVAVCLYELTREGFEGARALPVMEAALATAGDRERLTALLQQTMDSTGYGHRFPANARPAVIRRLVGQLGSTRDEAATWTGIFRFVLRALQGGRSSQGPGVHTDELTAETPEGS